MSEPVKLWWFTQDEEHLHGSAHSHDEAISKGIVEYCGHPFMVCQGDHFRNQAPHIDAGDWAERFDEVNSKYMHEDGDSGSVQWSAEACRDLETMMTATFDAWIDKHDYRKAWAIDCGAYECIDPALLAARAEPTP